MSFISDVMSGYETYPSKVAVAQVEADADNATVNQDKSDVIYPTHKYKFTNELIKAEQ